MPFPGNRPVKRPALASGGIKIDLCPKKCLPSADTSHKRILPAEVAQLVEQGTENPRVGSSILSLGTIQKSVKDQKSPV